MVRFDAVLVGTGDLLNTALAYQVTRDLNVMAGINNLTDEYYINDDMSSQEAGNAGAPRNFFVRLRQTF